jgi:hypothetical protein
MSLKHIIYISLIWLGLAATIASPGRASVIQNGTFEGAEYANCCGNPSGTFLVPFNFTAHTYLSNFAWTNTGCYCLDWVANNGSQVISRAPANPAGYTGNVYVADASPSYDVGTYLLQTLTNLTVGQKYTISFLQASGSYYNGVNDTAQWQVGWGGSVSWGPTGWTLTGDTSQLSPLMTNDLSTGTSPWERAKVSFVATSPTELLSFFATGSGAPPFALLADVQSSVPEPSTWAMMGLGFASLAYAGFRRRSRPAVSIG